MHPLDLVFFALVVWASRGKSIGVTRTNMEHAKLCFLRWGEKASSLITPSKSFLVSLISDLRKKPTQQKKQQHQQYITQQTHTRSRTNNNNNNSTNPHQPNHPPHHLIDWSSTITYDGNHIIRKSIKQRKQTFFSTQTAEETTRAFFWKRRKIQSALPYPNQPESTAVAAVAAVATIIKFFLKQSKFHHQKSKKQQ